MTHPVSSTMPHCSLWPVTIPTIANPRLHPTFGNALLAPAVVGQAVAHVAEPLVQTQANWMYHLSRLEYIPAAILSPWMTNIQLKQAQLPLTQREPLVRQEVMRQVFGVALNTVTFFAGGSLTTPLLKGLQRSGLVSKAVASSPLAKFVGGMIASTLAFGLLRPFLINSALLQWLYDAPPTTPGLTPPASTNPATVSPQPSVLSPSSSPPSALSFMGAGGGLPPST
jgi:hypothetical protein